ncbi:MAG TPA: DeoR family transcriptional regulator [Candidatus Paceibacterota bacterium]|nr:DeoR family transcriptional regulator [Candidatus Paceibacterota bacterium]
MSDIENTSLGFAIFDSSAYFSFIQKKTEKLVAAMYLITNVIKDNEPIKWTVREKSLELVELSLFMRSASASELSSFFREYRSVADEIVSLVSITRHAGMVSPMNYEVLKNEFDLIMKTIAETEEKHKDTASLGLEFFATENISPISESEKKVQKDKKSGESMSFDKGHTQKAKNSDKNIKNTRKDKILNLLTKRNGLGIKDFSQEMKQVSEKTIQRDLLALVASGVLKKEGDRRWSRYFIK